MDKQTTQQRKESRRNRGLIIVLIVIILVLLGLIAYLMFGSTNDEQQPQGTSDVTAQLAVDPNAGELVTPETEEQEPGVAIPGWGSLTIPAGETEVQTSLQNPEANEGWYYLTFELRLKDTDEVLFTTGLIPPGQYCNQVTLTRAMEKGEYDAVIHVQPYRISDQSPTNNADMENVLIVE